MLQLKKIQQSDLYRIWKIAFTEDFPKWAYYNAPYFDEYRKVDYDDFIEHQSDFFLNHESVRGIYIDEEIIGTVSYYFESKKTRWLETGILLFDENTWNQGYGRRALSIWFDIVFEKYPEIQRIGITTWSGNLGMMKLAEKLGMTLEARIRKVRYYEGVYYDSIKYGILQEEWEKKK